MGIVVTNMAPQRSKEFFELIKSFSAPIYVLFFVLVGARLVLGNMPLFLWIIVALYVILRSLGKMAGAWIGAKVSGAVPVVRKYTGLSLFAQGGVAIGLSIMATQHLQDLQIAEGINLSDIIITGVTATTFIVQVIGPPMTKLAVKLAGETGRNITEEDVISEWTVSNVLNKDVPIVKDIDSIKHVVSLFTDCEYFCLPVVDQENKSVGMISMNDLKQLIGSQDTWEWLLVGDVISHKRDLISVTTPLEEAMNTMKQLGREQLPVVETEENPVPMGMLDLRTVRKMVNKKLVSA